MLGSTTYELQPFLSHYITEVAEPDGQWSTGYPGDPVGNLSKYDHLTRLQTQPKVWQQELKSTIESVFNGISGK